MCCPARSPSCSGAKTILLNEGDSVYFDPRIRHGQYAVDGEARFLTVIDKE